MASSPSVPTPPQASPDDPAVDLAQESVAGEEDPGAGIDSTIVPAVPPLPSPASSPSQPPVK